MPEFRQKHETTYPIRNKKFKVPRLNSKYGKLLPSYCVPQGLDCLELKNKYVKH